MGILDCADLATCTHTIAFTPRQYLSHMERNRGWPPRSQHLSVTCPFWTRFMLKPTVGIESIVNSPPANTLSSDVLPAFWRPIMVMSISVALSRSRSASSNLSRTSCGILGLRYWKERPTEAESTSDAGAWSNSATRGGQHIYRRRHIPEQAQQPIIQAPEDSHHDGQTKAVPSG